MSDITKMLLMCLFTWLAVIPTAQADTPLYPYPLTKDPCAEVAGADSLVSRCYKPKSFVWELRIEDKITLDIEHIKFENYNEMLGYASQELANRCPNCIMITEDVYNDIKDYNIVVAGKNLYPFYLETPASTSYSTRYGFFKWTSRSQVDSHWPPITTPVDRDAIVYNTSLYAQFVYGQIEFSDPNITPLSLPNRSDYKIIEVDNSFLMSGAMVPVCETGDNYAYLPSSLWENPEGTYGLLYYCVSEKTESITKGASDLDTIKEGCVYGCNPVNLATGDKVDYKIDYQNNSPFPIVIDRWYLSSANGWDFSHNRRLQYMEAGDFKRAILFRPDGSVLSFLKVTTSSPPTWKAQGDEVLGEFDVVSLSPDKWFSYKNLHQETEYYNEDGQLTFIENIHGNKISYIYTAGELTRIEDDFNRYVDLSHSGTGVHRNLSSLTDGEITLSFDIQTKLLNGEYKKLLKEVTYGDGKSVQYSYDEFVSAPNGLMTGITGEDNVRYATYAYDVNEQVMETFHGNEQDLMQYMFSSNDTYVTWDNGYAIFPTSSSFTELNKTSGSSGLCPNCSGLEASSISYTAKGAVSSSTSHDGVTTSRSYSGSAATGLPSSMTKYDGTSQAQTTAYTWDATSRKPLTMVENIEVDGVSETRTTTYSYDTDYNLTQMLVQTSTGEPSRTYSWTYNTKGQVLTQTTPLGTTAFTYDATSGNLLTKTNALSQQTTYSSYTPRGLVGKITSPSGLETVFSYDNRDRLTQVKRGTVATHWETVDFEYTDFGAIEKITYPDLSFVEYSYDDAHRLTQIETPLGKMVLTLDVNGDATKEEVFDVSNNLIQTKSKQYDAYRNVKKVLDAQSVATNFSYNTGKLYSISDPDGDFAFMWNRGFDAQGRTSYITDDRRNIIQYEYDNNDNPTKITDGNFIETLFSYNGFGELSTVQSQDKGFLAISRNTSGLVSIQTDGRLVDTSFTYDALGRPTQIVFDGSNATPVLSNETQTFTYDSCTNGVGKLCQTTDNQGTTSYTYDLWGRVTSKTIAFSTPSSVSLTTYYDYNSQGQLVSITYPSGRRLDYTYSNGLPSLIEYDFTTIAQNIHFRPLSNEVLGWTWGYSGTVNFDFDQNGRIEGIVDVDTRDYLYNAKGWLLGISDPVNSSFDQLYDYNAPQNLVQADLAARPDPIEYQFDDNDNITYKSVGPLSQDKSYYGFWTNYMIKNRPDYILEAGSSYSETYDDAGNITNTGNGLLVTYDAKNRMSASSRLGVSATYGVNFEGLRVRKSGAHLSTGHRLYAYDEQRRLLGVYDGTGTPIEEYVYLDGFRVIALVRGISSTSSPAQIYPVLSDHLGTPRKVLDNSGNPMWSWDAKDPYGFQAPNELLSGTVFQFNLRFPGQTFDVETGLYHNGFRDYDPSRGRYIQPDPIGLKGGMNVYTYAGSDPINSYDPLGLKVEFVGPDKERAVHSVDRLKSLSPTFRQMYLSLEESESLYKIDANTKNINNYGEMKNKNGDVTSYRVWWNPDFYLKCKTDGRLFSPESGLAHEISHAYRDMLKNNKNRLPAHVEEFFNLKYERMIHMEMGWPKGRSYYEYFLSGPAKNK